MWRIGCCGFAAGREKYYRRFNLIEIQQTFYKLPVQDVAPIWRQKSPPDFEFVLKASQLITHLPSSPTYRRLGRAIPKSKYNTYGAFRPTPEVRTARARMERLASQLQSRILLYQCPPSFKPTPENVKNLKRFFGRPNPLRVALELRGQEWESARISDLCADLNVIPVVDPLVREPLHGRDVAYFRLHGLPAYHYGYRYSPSDLRGLHKRLAILNVQDCYVLFNNFTMFQDASAFQRLCK